MADEEPEYEVESIIEAKVEKVSRAKNSRLIWKYRVRWKGYSAAEDTWEPLESFNGSEHFVTWFWERSSTDGRNVEDLTQFHAGETFHPIGPPKRKPKRKRASHETIEHGHTPQPPDIHVTDSVVTDGSPPAKRIREDKQTISNQPSSQAVKQPLPSRIRRRPSPEVIPDSDEEMNGVAASKNYLSPHRRELEPSPDKVSEAIRTDSPKITDEDESFDPLFDEVETKLPDHLSRREKPLVKLAQTSVTPLHGAISAKARATRGFYHTPSSQGPSTTVRGRPGPGRSSTGLTLQQKSKSSLLTAEKGSLKTIKGKYKEAGHAEEQAPITDNLFHSPAAEENGNSKTEHGEAPSGRKLLELSGLDGNIGDLPDFDEPAKENAQSTKDIDLPPLSAPKEPNYKEFEEPPPGSKASTAFPRHDLFSQFAPSSSPNIVGDKPPVWKQRTIFGPLSLGSGLIPKSQHPESSSVFLNLDSSLSVPALLINPTSPDPGTLIPMLGNRGAPGKFYGKEASLTLLGSLRAGGLSANVVVNDGATKEEKEHFNLFSSRLQIGDIFVAVAGIHILVFCSSDNSLLSQRLNIPPVLQNVKNSLIVSQVDVENYSGYADATSNADERRWVQYVGSVS